MTLHRCLYVRRLGSRWPIALAMAAALFAAGGAAGPAAAQPPSSRVDELPPWILDRLKLDPPPANARGLDRLLAGTGRMSPAQDEIEPVLLDQALGGVWAAAQAGEHVYLGVGSRVVVLERGNGETPSIVGRTDSLPGAVLDLAVQGDRLYVVADIVYVFDVSEPARPRELVSYDAPTATELHVEGDRMILLHGDSQLCGPGVEAVDIADPSRPTRLSRGLTCTQDYAVDMDVEGDLVYFVTLAGGLYVFRMDGDDQLSRTGAFYNESIGLAVEVVGDYAYFAFTYLFASGVFIVDVSDPTIPTPMDVYQSNVVGDIQSHGELLYLAQGAGMEVLDISRPTAPRQRGLVEQDSWVVRTEVLGEELLALGGGAGGLIVYGLSDPAAPTRTTHRAIGGSVQGVAVDAGWLLVASEEQGMWSAAEHDPNAVFDLLSEPGPAAYPFGFVDVEIEGIHAFMAWDGGLAVMPLGGPTDVDALAQAPSLAFNNDLALADDRAYLVGSTGLTIFDVSIPIDPRELGRLELPGSGEAVAVSGGTAYVADGEEGVHAIDVTDPSSPRITDTFTSDGEATGVDVGLGYVFVAAERALHVVEVLEDGVMEEWSYLEGPSRRVRVVGNRAYELTEYGLRIVDLEEPGAPFVLAEEVLPGTCVNIQVVGAVAYLACGSGGLVVLDVGEPAEEPATPTATATRAATVEPTVEPTATGLVATPTAEATPAVGGVVYLPALSAGD